MTQPAPYRVLVVDDNSNDRVSMQRLLQDAGYHVSVADSADKALGYLDEHIDFVLADLQMGDVSGMDLLRHWKLRQPQTGFLIISGYGTVDTVIEAIRAGAYHYMTKPIEPEALIALLKSMANERQQVLKTEARDDGVSDMHSLNNIIGNTPQMQQVFELILRSAQAFSTVLILGESGTGKELVGQAIHLNSPRRDGPFKAVNCAAMPATLVESELFGHEKGAFTGAEQRRMGCFEAASGGTLFIDEIGDFDPSLQVKLLRVMENRVVTPVGGNEEIKVDTRVVAATSRDIRDMMKKGQFREDLYYRLNVVTIELPPLRQRLDDVPLLVKAFMGRINKQNGTRITGINSDVIDLLKKYQWPGNVRELHNIVERMMVLSKKQSIDIEDLPQYIRDGDGGRLSTAANDHPALLPLTVEVGVAAPAIGSDTGLRTGSLEDAIAGMTLAELQDVAISVALRRCDNNRRRAALALGISDRTLVRKLGKKLKCLPGDSEPVALKIIPKSSPPDSFIGAGNRNPEKGTALDHTLPTSNELMSVGQ